MRRRCGSGCVRLWGGRMRYVMYWVHWLKWGIKSCNVDKRQLERGGQVGSGGPLGAKKGKKRRRMWKMQSD